MALVNGADGCVETAVIVTDNCCAPPVCGASLCTMFCSFIQILPSGPMWDYWKAKALGYFQSSEVSSGIQPYYPVCTVNMECPSLVQHAIYAATMLVYFINNLLGQVVREASPYTSVQIDMWLKRLQWQDCYKQHCRPIYLNTLSPYEIPGPCGPEECLPYIPPELTAAVNRGIVIALSRARMGGIKNLCWLNWVIEPLGAKLVQHNAAEMKAKTDEWLAACTCVDIQMICPPGCEIKFDVTILSDYLPAAPGSEICVDEPLPPVLAYTEQSQCQAVGLPAKIYPGIVAADCLVRSLLNKGCNSSPQFVLNC